jgi:uncharacterized membrane protein YfcA
MFDLPFFIFIFGLGFIFEYIDSALGGGFGTILTPLFMSMGYSPLEIVPIILLSEAITGFLGGALHNGFGNVNKRVGITIAVFAILGSLIGVTIAVSIPSWLLKLYIGVLVLVLGILMLRKYFKGEFKGKFAWSKIVGIGSLCGFNKAISGGGFGPVATSGLSLSGIDPKKAVGSTILAEGVMSIVAILLYNTVMTFNWNIAIPLIIGAALSTFPASYTTFKLNEKKFLLIVGSLIALLGTIILVKMIL